MLSFSCVPELLLTAAASVWPCASAGASLPCVVPFTGAASAVVEVVVFASSAIFAVNDDSTSKQYSIGYIVYIKEERATHACNADARGDGLSPG